jgi:hypothetical protein
MSNIDKIITEGHLRGTVKVVDFDAELTDIENDITEYRKLCSKHDVKDDKTLAGLLSKQESLIKLARQWVKKAGLKEYGNNRIVILLEAAE